MRVSKLLMLLTIVFFVLFRNDLFAAEADENISFFLSANCRYAKVITEKSDIKQTGLLWDQIFESSDSRTSFESKIPYFDAVECWNVVNDVNNDRFFVLLGSQEARRFYGYLVIQYSTLKYDAFLQQEMGFEDAYIVSSLDGSRIVISYYDKTFDEGKPSLWTNVYDGKSYELISKSDKSPFTLNRALCTVKNEGELLFTGKELLEVPSLKIRRKGSVLTGRILTSVACKDGIELLLAKNSLGEITLVLYDVTANKLLSERSASYKINFIDVSEWFFLKEHNVVIRDESMIQGARLEKTGRLIIFDLKRDLKYSEVNINIESSSGKILGFLEGSNTLLYVSKNRISLVSIPSAKVVKEFTLPFPPIGVID